MKLQFLGGAQTVTGSKTLVTLAGHRILVDCGLFQGLKELRLKNWEPFPVKASSIDAVVLTHAHLDHCGYLPLLVRSGFCGKIYCSDPTRDLAELILEDSAKLQEEDADFANRHGYSKHHPALPLYTEKDVKRTMNYFEPIPPGKWQELPGKTRVRLLPSGHILGSTFVEIETKNKRLVFSGDLGRTKPIVLEPATLLDTANYLVLESTYGDRTHHSKTESLKDRLSKIIRETTERGGQVIIPSFAVGRAQDLLFLFSQLKAEKTLPSVPIYLDTPMGINATQIFVDHPQWHRLSPEEVTRLMELPVVVRSQKESIQIMREAKPCVVIAGSGMLSGGRVLHHLEARLSDEKNTVLFVGFQPAGTRGRLLKEGTHELKIHGKYIPVRCQVEDMGDLSAHADQSETLAWLQGFQKAPQVVLINHGEPQASDALRVKIKDTFKWRCEVPHLGQEFELD